MWQTAPPLSYSWLSWQTAHLEKVLPARPEPTTYILYAFLIRSAVLLVGHCPEAIRPFMLGARSNDFLVILKCVFRSYMFLYVSGHPSRESRKLCHRVIRSYT